MFREIEETVGAAITGLWLFTSFAPSITGAFFSGVAFIATAETTAGATTVDTGASFLTGDSSFFSSFFDSGTTGEAVFTGAGEADLTTGVDFTTAGEAGLGAGEVDFTITGATTSGFFSGVGGVGVESLVGVAVLTSSFFGVSGLATSTYY